METTLSDRLFYATASVTAHLKTGKTTVGTAFFYAANVSANSSIVLLVSNKHILSDAHSLQIDLHAGNQDGPRPGERYTVQVGPGFEVLEHPDPDVDVAALNVSTLYSELRSHAYFLHVGSTLSLNASTDVNLIDAIEQVRFIGYPLGLYDSANLLPISRSGHTASPLLNNYEGKEAFLVDASVFPGSSGSPVFILDTNGFYQTRDGNSNAGRRCIFLGVLAAFQTRQVSGQVARLPASTLVKAEEALDLGLVFKASTVDHLINLVKARLSPSQLDPS